MFDVIRTTKFAFAAMLTAAVVTMGGPTQSQAQTGSVRIKIVKAGFIVGVGGGSGTLHYHGRNYPFRVGGMSIGTIGAAGAHLARISHRYVDGRVHLHAGRVGSVGTSELVASD